MRNRSERPQLEKLQVSKIDNRDASINEYVDSGRNNVRKKVKSAQKIESDQLTESVRLNQIFQKYGLNNSSRSTWVKSESAEAQKEFREAIEDLEKSLKKANPELYDKARIEKIIVQQLLFSSPVEIRATKEKLNTVTRLEEINITTLDQTLNVNGQTYRAMSQESKGLYLQYYRTLDLSERTKLIPYWQRIVNHEAKLTEKLVAQYKGSPSKLAEILKAFSNMNFMEKEKAIKDREKTQKEEAKKLLERNKLIDKAENSGLINTQTANELKTKTLSIKEIEQILEKAQKTRDQFNKKTKNHENKKILTKEFDSADLLQRENLLSDLETNESPEKNLAETIKSALDLMHKDNPEDALILLMQYQKQFGTNKKLKFTIKTIQNYMLEFEEEIESKRKTTEAEQKPTTANKEDTSKEKIQENIESTLKQADIQEEIKERKLILQNIKGQRISEKRNNGSIKAHKRAQSESLKSAQNSTEKDLTKSFYKQSPSHILDEDGKGQKVENINISADSLSKNSLRNLREKTEANRKKLENNTGFTHINLRDSSGEIVSADAAEKTQQQKLRNLSKKIAIKCTTDISTGESNIIDLRALQTDIIDQIAA